MAGTLNIALAQQLDLTGLPLKGAQLYFFQSGTVATPQNAYQDYGLTIPLPNPIEVDVYGRLPMFYLADGQVHVRLTDATGVVIFDYPNMQVIGPSSGGGGGGGSVDPTTVFSTGDFKLRPTSETLTGWVKANGTTIGGATSGASQRANTDTQNLFVYLWINFPNSKCPVSGGRGSSGLADFTAANTIGLPDFRGRALWGLDDMGSTPAGRILNSNITSSGDNVTTAAATGGEANHTLVVGEAPKGQFTYTDPGHKHGGVLIPGGGPGLTSTPVEFVSSGNTGTATTGITLVDNAGGLAHNNMSPFMLGTVYIRL
jgi:hypothetical protein